MASKTGLYLTHLGFSFASVDKLEGRLKGFKNDVDKLKARIVTGVDVEFAVECTEEERKQLFEKLFEDLNI